MSFLRKFPVGSSSDQPVLSEDAEFKLSYPALSEFLTCPRYPDGTARQLSTLTFFRDDNYWKACLNEKDQGLVLFVAEQRFTVLLEALELLLQEESPPWRKSNVKQRPGSRAKGQGT